MSFRPLDGFIDFPLNDIPEDPHMGIEFDYEFAEKRLGEQLSLLIHSWVIDYQGKIYSRKGNYILSASDSIECVIIHIRNHLVNLGVDDMSCRRLMRDFEVENYKSIPYDTLTFNMPAR